MHHHPMRVRAFQILLLRFQHRDEAWAVSFVLVQRLQKVLRDRRSSWLTVSAQRALRQRVSLR